MLRERILTALVLVALLVPALAAEAAWPFGVLSLVLLAAAGWEWGRLNGAAGVAAWGCGALLTLACLGAWQAGWVARTPVAIWWLGAIGWVLGGAAALKAGPQGWPTLPAFWRLALGLIALWVAWLALAAARTKGLPFILSLLCVVWMADIAAYAGGRAFGRRKLAPSISPGKSWEGAFSGAVGVLLLAWAWLSWEQRGGLPGPSLYSVLVGQVGWLGAAGVLLGLTAMSVVGDLFESLAKRAAGVKDSSRLLPGHGGVLDRVDALLPTLPLAMAAVSWS